MVLDSADLARTLKQLRKDAITMMQVQEGQCGLCVHFGENQPKDPKVIQIRLKHEAEENVIEECGHPRLAPLRLMVTPISGCAGFEPAKEAVSPQA